MRSPSKEEAEAGAPGPTTMAEGVAQTEPQAEEQNTPAPPRPVRRGGGNAIVGVLLVAFALCGVYEVVHGTASTSSDPTRFAAVATDNSGSSATPSGAAAGPSAGSSAAASIDAADAAILSKDPCIREPLSGLVVVNTLRFVARLPIRLVGSQVGTGATPRTASGACNQATFQDERGTGTDTLAVYPTAADATGAASRIAHASTVVTGRLVFTLDPSLAQYRNQYLTATNAPTPAARAAKRP
jgi:hypothetical protein